MKVTHQLRCFDVDGVLIAERTFLNAEDKSEILYVIGKLVKKKTNAFILIEIVKLECLKVADENIARKFVFFESGKIVERLCLRSLKILSGTLLFNEENTF